MSTLKVQCSAFRRPAILLLWGAAEGGVNITNRGAICHDYYIEEDSSLSFGSGFSVL